MQVHSDITEVLASHGNNHLGGDDFDQLLLDFVHHRFVDTGGVDIRADRRAMSRLLHAVEEAKKRLRFEPYARLREHLAERNGVPVHLDVEVSAANTNNSSARSWKGLSTVCIAPSLMPVNGQIRSMRFSSWAAPPVRL